MGGRPSSKGAAAVAVAVTVALVVVVVVVASVTVVRWRSESKTKTKSVRERRQAHVDPIVVTPAPTDETTPGEGSTSARTATRDIPENNNKNKDEEPTSPISPASRVVGYAHTTPEEQTLLSEAADAAGLTPEERATLTHDVRVRFIRGSRFIRAHKARKAYLAKKLRATTEWRVVFRPETVLETPPLPVPTLKTFREEAWPVRFHGNDALGVPIVSVRLADINLAAVARDTSYTPRFLDAMGFHQESMLWGVMRRQSLDPSVRNMRAGEKAVQVPYTLIVDLEHMGLNEWRQVWSLGFARVAAFWGAHYPETLRQLYIMHAPRLLSMALAAIGPLLEPDTREKLVITSSTSAFTEAAIGSGRIPAHSLPRKWGGTRPDDAPVEWAMSLSSSESD